MFLTLAFMCVTSSFPKEQGFAKYLSALEYSLPKINLLLDRKVCKTANSG